MYNKDNCIKKTGTSRAWGHVVKGLHVISDNSISDGYEKFLILAELVKGRSNAEYHLFVDPFEGLYESTVEY